MKELEQRFMKRINRQRKRSGTLGRSGSRMLPTSVGRGRAPGPGASACRSQGFGGSL